MKKTKRLLSCNDLDWKSYCSIKTGLRVHPHLIKNDRQCYLLEFASLQWNIRGYPASKYCPNTLIGVFSAILLIITKISKIQWVSSSGFWIWHLRFVRSPCSILCRSHYEIITLLPKMIYFQVCCLLWSKFQECEFGLKNRF